jgi:hypothetical protein
VGLEIASILFLEKPEEIICMRRLILTFVLFTCGQSTASLGAEVPKIPQEVEIYFRELNTFSNSAATGLEVEGLLRLGRNARDVLTRPREGGTDVLEELSEGDFQKVALKMKGFVVNRQETLNVDPIPSFFLALAKRAGDQASVEFFEAYNKTKPDGGWEVYVEQQTDYSGCIRFGTMSLVDSYVLWDAFSKKYPTRYQGEVKRFVNDIEFDLGSGTCACGDKKSAIAEFENFVRVFPNGKLSARVRERINQISQGMSDIREQCHSG